MSMTRLACFFVPMFPLAARLRSEPELLPEAVAIVEGNGNNAHIVAATRRARKKGIHRGLSLAQARSIVPKLIARGRDAECERTAQEALIEIGEMFSPRVEDASDGLLFVDISGTERHYPNEEELARSAIRALDAITLPARVGIAASKLAARVAAELPQTPTVVPPGEEAKFLAPLPLARLSPEIEAAAMLERLGLESIGDLARLPESEIASRLGEIGRELHFAARGIDPRPLIPRALPPEFREGMELEWPLVALEPFIFIANAALDRLSKRMETQGFACKRIELTLTLEPDGYDARAIDLPAPTRDVKTILTLIRLDLEKRPPGAPVIGFSFVAHPDPVAGKARDDDRAFDLDARRRTRRHADDGRRLPARAPCRRRFFPPAPTRHAPPPAPRARTAGRADIPPAHPGGGDHRGRQDRIAARREHRRKRARLLGTVAHRRRMVARGAF